MKKYILLLVILSFVLAFSAHSASALDSSNPSEITCPNGKTVVSNCTEIPEKYDLSVQAVHGGVKSYKPGQTNIVIGEFNFSALADITMSSVGFSDNILDQNENHSFQNSKDFQDISLWINETKISRTIPNADEIYGYMDFPDSSFDIKAGEVVKVIIRADIAKDALGTTHAVQISSVGTSGENSVNLGDPTGFFTRDSIVNIISPRPNVRVIGIETPTVTADNDFMLNVTIGNLGNTPVADDDALTISLEIFNSDDAQVYSSARSSGKADGGVNSTDGKIVSFNSLIFDPPIDTSLLNFPAGTYRMEATIYDNVGLTSSPFTQDLIVTPYKRK